VQEIRVDIFAERSQASTPERRGSGVQRMRSMPPPEHTVAASDLVRLPRRQYTELMAIGIDQNHPTDFALADVDSGWPRGK
jgi:hypothetical protein